MSAGIVPPDLTRPPEGRASPPPFLSRAEADLREAAHASGPFSLTPVGVARPGSTEGLRRLLDWCRETRRHLIPRGAGTGMPGGNVGTGVVVDLVHGFDWMDPVDPENRTLRVGPGVVAEDADRAAGEHGLFLPPLPSSLDRCTLGGMAANNAAGHRSFRFGPTGAWVESLEVMLADGSLHWIGAPGREPPPGWSPLPPLPPPLDTLLRSVRARPAVRKNSSGYDVAGYTRGDGDLRALFIGSEGTLGLLTGITLRLAPRPEALGVGLVGLGSVDEIPDAARAAEAAGLWAVEFLGRRFLEVAGLREDPAVGPYLAGMDAAVLVEAGGSEREVSEALEAMGEWARSAGLPWTRTTAPEAREALWSVRRRASPLLKAQARHGLMSTQFIEDSVVPVDALPDYLRGLDQILARYETDAVWFGHAGDGNVHVNPLIDRTDPRWPQRVRGILEETVDLVAGLGGTLAGEHGDGRVRAPFLERIWGAEAVVAFRALKDHFDPGGILNPGVILPLPGQDPLEGLGAGWTEAGP